MFAFFFQTESIPNVYKMPDPIKKDPDQIRDYRIPEPLPQTDEPLDINTAIIISNKFLKL
jgi:hypothetical protein